MLFVVESHANEHPVLFMDKTRVKELRSAKRDTHREIWRNLVTQADKLLKTGPPRYRTDKGEQLWQREVGDNIALLAFIGCISGDRDYFEAAAKWAHGSAAYPTWGLTGQANGTEFGLPYGHQLMGLAMLYDYGQDYLSKKDLDIIRQTLIYRTGRQYQAYLHYSKPYMQRGDAAECGDAAE